MEPCGLPCLNSPAHLRWTHGHLSCWLRWREEALPTQTLLPVRAERRMKQRRKTCWIGTFSRNHRWCSSEISKTCSTLTRTCIYTDLCTWFVCGCASLWSVGFQLQRCHQNSSKNYCTVAKPAHAGESLVGFPFISLHQACAGVRRESLAVKLQEDHQISR